MGGGDTRRVRDGRAQLESVVDSTFGTEQTRVLEEREGEREIYQSQAAESRTRSMEFPKAR